MTGRGGEVFFSFKQPPYKFNLSLLFWLLLLPVVHRCAHTWSLSKQQERQHMQHWYTSYVWKQTPMFANDISTTINIITPASGKHRPGVSPNSHWCCEIELSSYRVNLVNRGRNLLRMKTSDHWSRVYRPLQAPRRVTARLLGSLGLRLVIAGFSYSSSGARA